MANFFDDFLGTDVFEETKKRLGNIGTLSRRVNKLPSLIDNVDWDKLESEMNRRFNEIKKAFNDTKEELSLSRFIDNNKITVPYNRDTDTLKMSVSDGDTVTIEVKTENEDGDVVGSNLVEKKFAKTIDHVEQKYNKLTKTMMFNVILQETIDEVEVKYDEDEIKEIEVEDNLQDEEEIDVEDNGQAEEEVADDEIREVTHDEENDETDIFDEVDRLSDKIAELFEEGKSFRAIAREAGVSDKTVARRVRKMGLKR